MGALKLMIAGAGGRMGLASIIAAAQSDLVEVGAALESEGSSLLGKDAGSLAGLEPLGVGVTANLDTALAGTEAIIDFTTPAASVALAGRAAERALVHVIGTTGASADEVAAIRAAGGRGARIVMAGNMSLGVNLLTGLVKRAAAALDEAYDIEIVEMHHNRKVDAPSGTALMLGAAAANGRGVDLENHSVRGRDGHTGPRQAGTIGFAALRGGTVVGEHTVVLAGPGERIELAHKAQDRSVFANGAIKAALWAATQPPGFYTMDDVLNL